MARKYQQLWEKLKSNFEAAAIGGGVSNVLPVEIVCHNSDLPKIFKALKNEKWRDGDWPYQYNVRLQRIESKIPCSADVKVAIWLEVFRKHRIVASLVNNSI